MSNDYSSIAFYLQEISRVMITSDYKDSDGFRLQFEEKCPESDREYFIEQYPRVDDVSNKRLHCTTCDTHIGTAPISEKIVRTHLVLAVTQCNKCFAFYNSGEFGKGEDGSEYYCRWCGQGGEVFCCSSCPFVFCNKCIRSNLSNSYVKEIEENDDWSCFVCNKNILKTHRAQHWALRNFMNKQLEKIQKSDFHDEDEVNNLLNGDSSSCCPRKKRKSFAKPIAAPVKRPQSVSREYLSIQPPVKKPHIQNLSMLKVATAPPTAKVSPRTTTNSRNSEIVCTPDIMGLFNENDDSAIPTTNMMPSTSIAPPPLIMRNNQVRVTRPQLPIPSPIYHNVNGYQIDLNHAARQDIFRLPNGKLIQVRKQTAAAQQVPSPFRQGPATIAPRQPQFTIRQANPVTTTARMFRPQMPQTRLRPSAHPQQRFTFSDGRVVATPVAQPASQAPAAGAPMSSVFTQQNGSISVARAPQPNTPFGKVKTEFEDKIISGMEICQHTINKMITLTNSSSFKQSRTFTDVKDLYVHLEYLFSYTADKFKTLQDNLKVGKENLLKHDVASKEKCDNDELEIVEEKTDIIEVLSDDDEESSAPEKERPGPASAKRSLLKHIQYRSIENPKIEGVNQASETAAISTVESSLSTLKAHLENDNAYSLEVSPEFIASDKKLKDKVVVKVEKLENTKNPIIKHFMSQLQERIEKQKLDGSSEGTPDNLLDLEVTIEENIAEKEKSPLPSPFETIDDDENANKAFEVTPVVDKAFETETVERGDDEKDGNAPEESSIKDINCSETVDDEKKNNGIVSCETSFEELTTSLATSEVEEIDDDKKENAEKICDENSFVMEIEDDADDKEKSCNKDVSIDISSDLEVTKEAEGSSVSPKGYDVPKIDNAPSIELMEIDDDDEPDNHNSESCVELSIQEIPSDDEKELEKSSEHSQITENTTEKEESGPKIPKKNGTNDEELKEQPIQFESLLKNETLQEENCETFEDNVKNNSVKSSPTDALTNDFDQLPLNIITSNVKSIDDLLTNTQDLIDREQEILDDFFDDLEEHVM